nr:reverse transcriptase domain-containing protein [Tanacetum cinerariifolium]
MTNPKGTPQIKGLTFERTIKQKVTQSFEQVKEIAFPPLAASNGTEGLLVIEAEIGGHIIHRMYIDGGSLMKILYEHYFNQLQPEIKSQMVPATTSLTGFSGETIWLRGQLRLLVVIGDATHSTKAWMNFMVVKSLSPYNGIIGRLGLKAIQAVPSTVHGMLKFPVEGGIVTICSTILIPTECASMTTSWRMCVDFTNLNKACPQDCYPLPEIDWKVESLCGYPFMCFLDAYKGYHQIQLAEANEEKTGFHTGQGVYCYTKMPFGLKNAGATYQRLMDKAFEGQVGRNIEVYVDNLVVKSYTEAEMMRDIEETFRTLHKVNMKLNPKKCSFRLAEGVFLWYVITPEGIKPYFLIEMPCEVSQAAPAGVTQEVPWTLFTDGSSCVDGSDALSKITSTSFAHLSKQVLVEVLENKSIKEKEVAAMIEEDGPTWMTQLVDYLKEGILPGDEKEARKLRLKAQNRHSRPLSERAGEGQIFESRHGLLHEVDRSKGNGNNYWWIVIPTEIGMPTYRTAAVDVVNNNEELRLKMDLLEERRERAAVCEANAKLKMMKYYNARVRGVAFKPRDFVYRNNDASHAVAGGKLGPK